MRRYTLILTATAVLTFTGCASTTQVVTRAAPQGEPVPVHRLLIAAHTPEKSIRATWESTCAPIFRKQGLDVVQSDKVLPDWYAGGINPLLNWAAAHDMDAVLFAAVTRMLPDKPNMPPADSTDSAANHFAEPAVQMHFGNNATDHKFHEVTPATPEEQSYDMGLFSVTQKTMVWNGRTTTHEANDISAVAASQCKAVAKTLRRLHFWP